jgi:hypothetical protein
MENKQLVALMAAIIFAIRDAARENRDPESGCAGGYSDSVSDAVELLEETSKYAL